MRALTRMRTLAAACALLLFVTGMAAAGSPLRPIDRGEGPDPRPPMVGDPDDPQGLTLGVWMPWGYVTFRIRVSSLKYFGFPVRASQLGPASARIQPRRGAHAR
jgi:hypothetical protein